MYWQNLPLFDTWINIANWRPGTYSVFRHGRIRHLPPSCRFGGVPVHHDPVDGICAKHEKWQWGSPNLKGGGRCWIRPWRNTEYVPGRPFAIFIQVSNEGIFCQYISLPMKYTVSGSTLQYKVGLTLSFLSAMEFLDMEKFTSTVFFVFLFRPPLNTILKIPYRTFWYPNSATLLGGSRTFQTGVMEIQEVS